MQTVVRSTRVGVEFILHLLFLLMISSAGLQVFTRYVVERPLAWTEEVTRLALIVYVFLGAASAMASGRHPRFGDLVDGLPFSVRRFVDGVVAAAIVVPTAVVGAYAIGVGNYTREMASAVPLPFSVMFWLMALGLLLSVFFFLVSDSRLRNPVTGLIATIAGLAMLAGIFFAPAPYVGAGLQSLLLVVALVVLLAIGVPVGFALLGASLFGFWMDPYSPLDVVPQRVLGGVDSFLFIAVPFFLMAGEIMNRTGITSYIVDIARAVVGHLRGGLAQVNIFSSFLMGGLSGSSSADCAALGKLLIPEMKRGGYSAPFSAAVTAASSILANLVPPSINLLIYAGLASASVGSLFLAGIIPAVVLMVAMMVVVFFYARNKQDLSEGDGFSPQRLRLSLRKGMWALGFPAIIVIGIRAGIFTATEAAAVAVFYALFLGIAIYRNFPWRKSREMLLSTAEDTSVVLFIIAASTPFAWMLTVQQVPQTIAAGLGPIADNWILLLLLVNVLLLIVGLVLEPAPAMVILVPILLPILKEAGIDLVHFGIIMVVNLFIGALTPPIGNLAFIAAMVSGTKPSAVFLALVPFLVALIAALALITYVPSLSLFLPSMVR